MDSIELRNQIKELENQNTKESYKNILSLVSDKLKNGVPSDEMEEWELKKLESSIHILLFSIDELGENDALEEINLRGKVIQLYKNCIKISTDNNKKMEYRSLMLTELKKHKEALKKKKNIGKISIAENVGLTIQEISDSIKIFMEEKDVINKVKKVGKEVLAGTTSAGLIMIALGLSMQTFMGVPFTLSNLVHASPAVAYIGLSSIIRNLSNKTAFEQYQYQHSDEFKAIVQEFQDSHKEEICDIQKIQKEKENLTDKNDIMSVNDELIKKLDKLIHDSNIEGIKMAFGLQALSALRENKSYCEQLKEAYLKEENNDLNEYKENNKRLMKYNIEIFKRGNSISSAVLHASKNAVNSMKVIALAKLILSIVSPNIFPLNNISSFIEPFAYSLINGLVDIPTYQNKLKYKETDYEGKVKLQNKERIEAILENQNKSLAYA